ncbi:MAG: discoidin domain-containing protein [Thermomonas sp.]
MKSNPCRVLPIAALLLSGNLAAGEGRRVLDDFRDTSQWTVVVSDGVQASLEPVDAPGGRGLCLAYDFGGRSGYATARRMLAIDYPPNYAFDFQLRGEGPPNNLEFKLVDASGDNVWWVKKPDLEMPAQWTPQSFKQRMIGFAWGPTADRTLRTSAALEFTISGGKGGGKGRACIAGLELRELPVDDGSPLAGTLAHGVDGWTVDLGRVREFGGAILRWNADARVSDYTVALSTDGSDWRTVRTVRDGDGGEDLLALPESEARYLRIATGEGRASDLAGVDVQPLAFAATPNDFLKQVAARAPRGTYPRGISGEQPYWTLLGVDGGHEQGLIGEDGAIELSRGGFSIEPFVVADGKLVTWADVQSTQSLQDGDLPIPSVHWAHPGFALDVTAFASGTPDRSRLVARYVLANTSDRPRDYVLALAARPFQVNPTSQFLSTPGGVSPIHALSWLGSQLVADGHPRVFFAQAPDSMFATNFDAGEAVVRLARGSASGSLQANDDSGLASGAALYRFHLQPGERREFAWRAPLAGEFDPTARFDPATAQAQAAAEWRRKLDAVSITLPSRAKAVSESLRTALAYILMSRDGPELRPGTRSYARSWIRDGAMMNDALLRLGRGDVADAYVRWYAPFQFDNGKVPCCVDARGSDPVPENDSQGELVHAIAQLYRYGKDRDLLASQWPHVDGAVRYMDALRASERTEANRANNPAFFGLVPASISHEGYMAKPMHSYWDDFWSLRGYDDAIDIARWLGRDADAARIQASRDQFRADLEASIALSVKQHGIDYIPGAAELGDFDPTSTTIALAPGDAQSWLPPDLLRNTFERYWNESVQRRDGQRAWKDYTPYELRTLGSFARLGWRERAGAMLGFFLAAQQPTGWRQWGEVVSSTPRKPFFLGDLPHAWVESDYIRSVLDMLAYERDGGRALVLAGGVPAAWLGEGISVDGLRTPQGALHYALKREGDALVWKIGAGMAVPPGGIVLTWPLASAPGRTTVDGKPAAWRDGELRIDRLPAVVRARVE